MSTESTPAYWELILIATGFIDEINWLDSQINKSIIAEQNVQADVNDAG